MSRSILHLCRCQSGATALEYAVIAGLLSIVILTAVAAAGDSLLSLYGSIATKVTAALSG